MKAITAVIPSEVTTSVEIDYVQCISAVGLHRMAYRSWGKRNNPNLIICVHGLTRRATDFNILAQRLSQDYRVICPDVVGRGDSDWLTDPKHYHVGQYVADMVTLIAAVKAQSNPSEFKLGWIGTSMGGLIGMTLAGLQNTPINSLILNDVGPHLEPIGLARIGKYVGESPYWTSYDDALTQAKKIAQTFAPEDEAQTLALSIPMIRPQDKGWTLHYDPAIAMNFNVATPDAIALGEVLLWHSYDAIKCPSLVIRGEYSDLFSEITHQAMAQRGPKAQLATVSGVGHAPSLLSEKQINLVETFLKSHV